MMFWHMIHSVPQALCLLVIAIVLGAVAIWLDHDNGGKE